MTRILCVGVDQQLLEIRCTLLQKSGYAAQFAMPAEIDEGEQFDLVILSLMLSNQQKEIAEAKIPPGTRILALDALVLPEELLRMVSGALSRKSEPA
ncbi:MAG TPA: hypothetical protein VMB49_22680 [Acidobacteriaceae bacterium]|nr:hypothetical protein [Acidobacteriaceae bacterium]